jgi:hypothetical protein
MPAACPGAGDALLPSRVGVEAVESPGVEGAPTKRVLRCLTALGGPVLQDG